MPGVKDKIRKALIENNLMDAYRTRPPHQQNDYIGWYQRVKLEAAKQKRLNQMFNELKEGIVYMRRWPGQRAMHFEVYVSTNTWPFPK